MLSQGGSLSIQIIVFSEDCFAQAELINRQFFTRLMGGHLMSFS